MWGRPFAIYRLFLLETVSTSCAAELSLRLFCNKDFVAVLAQLHGMLFICQQEAEHHMNPQHQRVEVPHNRWLFVKCDMVCGSIAAESRHTHLHGVTLFYRHPVIVQVIEEGISHIECPVLELIHKPVIGFCILPLEAHLHSHRLLGKCHSQS